MVDDTRREPTGLTEGKDARLTEAQNDLRDLASQIRAFAQAEPFAEWIVRRVGYDAAEISKALIGYSNEISTYDPNRAHFKKRIEDLMRFHPVDKRAGNPRGGHINLPLHWRRKEKAHEPYLPNADRCRHSGIRSARGMG